MLKISQEQENALLEFKKNNSTLEGFSTQRQTYSNRYKPLKHFSLDEFARLLYEPDSYVVDKKTYGAWVKSIQAGDNFNVRGQVDTVAFDDIVFSYFNDDNESDRRRLNKNDVVLLTPSEIVTEENRRMWIELRRSVGVFKIGDVLFDYENEIFLVTPSSFVSEGKVSVEDAKNWYQNGDVTGFHPIESFISFKKEEPTNG